MSYHISLSATRVDALFASPLQRSDDPGAWQVRQAIAAAVAAYGGPGCAARVAQSFGEHPETAVTRMRWARAMVAGAFGGAQPAQPALACAA
jgi:hypothetical protein